MTIARLHDYYHYLLDEDRVYMACLTSGVRATGSHSASSGSSAARD